MYDYVDADVRGEFVTPESYLERFELDVVKAVKTLVVASSEVHKRRVELLAPCLEAAVARGVISQVILPDPENMKPKRAQEVADAAVLLKRAIIQVAFCEAAPILWSPTVS